MVTVEHTEKSSSPFSLRKVQKVLQVSTYYQSEDGHIYCLYCNSLATAHTVRLVFTTLHLHHTVFTIEYARSYFQKMYCHVISMYWTIQHWQNRVQV